jgi:primosomal protein N' (replication factor Y)
MTAARTYIQVLLPVKLRWIPTYGSPVPLEPGRRVCVALGKRRYDGVVWRCLERPDLPPERIQDILAMQDDLPAVTAEELRFWEFLSEYYLCTPGEVYKAAYPLLKLRSERTAADILARLRERLAKKEQQLAGRHGERVTARLAAERDALLAEIAGYEDSGTLRSEATQGAREIPPVISKPLVLTAPERRDAFLPALRETLSAGRQALVLTPEIAFCNHLEALLAPEFDQHLLVFHSGRTPVQRRTIAERLRSGAPAVILGTRSALFLPYRTLGLVIVDEEQDPAYKQTEPAPRYHGRDTAIALAGIHRARVLLGAAVPSLETLLNVRLGKYALADSSDRWATPPDPLRRVAPTPRHSTTPIGESPEVIDLAAERRKNGLVGTFSRKLIEAVRQAEGPVLLLRGWEKPEPLQEEIDALFPGRDICVRTLNALKREGASGAALIAVLQADALVSRDDFRADERAAQIMGTLCQFAPHVIVQTAVPARFNGSRSTDDLLEERRSFGFPPYTRLVEIRRQGSGEVLDRLFLPRDRSLASRKAALAASLAPGTYPDVDPVD